jgi:hypothetical protein
MIYLDLFTFAALESFDDTGVPNGVLEAERLVNPRPSFDIQYNLSPRIRRRTEGSPLWRKMICS